MRSLLLILLGLLAATTVWSGPGLEQVLTEKILHDWQLDPGYTTVRLHRSSLSATCPDTFEIQAYPLTQGKPRGLYPMRVELCHLGRLVEKAQVTMEVRYAADLPVPARNVSRYEILSPDQFRLQRFDVTTMNEDVLTSLDQITGCRARYPLIAGRTISMTRIEKIPVVEQGKPVTIVGSAQGFEIRGKGIALESGGPGETVRVRYADAHKVITAAVTGPATVEISL